MIKIKVPNCIELYDLIAMENYRFICMEYAEQKTLKNKIQEAIKEKGEDTVIAFLVFAVDSIQ